ncbi:hypothetical protein EAX61_07150 [Dokdonia sinensis]|uniref:YdhG-like domain-containing protein n=1 Tax=Dokdonia sinensis TaxID=2479847 RepID=A0A3M0G6H3_9FLAO|nr:YdeI/OmpD-associated family protein [Dokdonia sinensis]RMB60591.1 hypothetical protein EAX61_07150 [Dokdonia sinensis]
MDKAEKLEAYYKKESPFKEGLKRIRQILNETELKEDWKWSFPCYTVNEKNVIGVGSFKNHFGIWFFQGSFLKDKEGILRNAQEGKTKALRSLHYESPSDIDPSIIRAYVLEAIANSHAGKEIKPTRAKKVTAIPEELKHAFKNDKVLGNAFKELTPGKQREYATHIGGAKQEATRLRRLEKCIPMIMSGKGLNDKYKNC